MRWTIFISFSTGIVARSHCWCTSKSIHCLTYSIERGGKNFSLQMNTYVRQSILYLTGDSRRFFLCIRCNQLIEKLSRRASLSFSFAIEYVSDVTVRARGNRQIDASFLTQNEKKKNHRHSSVRWRRDFLKSTIEFELDMFSFIHQNWSKTNV